MPAVRLATASDCCKQHLNCLTLEPSCMCCITRSVAGLGSWLVVLWPLKLQLHLCQAL